MSLNEAQSVTAVHPGAANAGSASSKLRRAIAVGIVMSGGALMAFIFTAIAPVLSAIGVHFGGGAGGDFVAQFVMTMPAIGIVVGGPMTGLLIERIGARGVLFGALALFGFAGAAGLVIDDSVTLLASRFILGVAGAGISTSTTALIGQWYAGAVRERLLGYWSSIGAVGGVVSILLAGAIGETGGWHAPFALYLVAFLALGLGLFAIRPSDGPAPAAKSGTGSVAPPGSIMMLWPIYLLMVPLYVGVFMTGVQLSFLVAANGISSPAAQSMIISMASVGSAIGAFSFGFILPRIGRSWTFVLFVSMMGGACLIMGLAHDPMLVALGAALNGAGGGLSNPYFASLILERVPVHLRGRALGFMYTILFGGEFINPLVVTPLRLMWNLHGAFIIIGAVLVAIAGVQLVRDRTAKVAA